MYSNLARTRILLAQLSPDAIIPNPNTLQDRDVKQSEGGGAARVRAPRGGGGGRAGPMGGRGGGRGDRPEASSGLQVGCGTVYCAACCVCVA